jgi:hypothetical protein
MEGLWAMGHGPYISLGLPKAGEMSRQLSTSAVLHALDCIAIFTLSGCTSLFYDDRCGPESRDVTIAERIHTPQGDSIGLALLSLLESRADYVPRSVSWSISGTVLRGHIGSARLVATENTGTPLLPLSGGPGEPDVVIQGELTPYTGPTDFNQLFDRANRGGLTIVLETDIPDRRAIALPLLEVVQFNDWGRAHCS